MRLTQNNIMFVKEYIVNNRAYQFYVAPKSKKVSDGRLFKVGDIKLLPVSVQKFINSHTPELWNQLEYDNDTTYSTYMYK